MESGSEGVADGDHIHSQGYGRGSSLFQLNLLRENLTTAELRCARIVEGLLFRLYLYSNTLKANATSFLHFDWMVSIYGRKIAAASGANGSRLLAPGLAGSQKFPSPDARHGWLYNRCLAAVNVNLLAQLSQTDGIHRCISLNTVHFEQKLQLSQNNSALWKLPRQQFSRGSGRTEPLLSC